MTRYRVKDELVGKGVVSQDGRDLGTVADLKVDSEDWHVHGVVVRLSRDVLESLNLKKPFVGTQEVLVGVGDVKSVSDWMVLARTVEQLAQVTAGQEGVETAETGADGGDAGGEDAGQAGPEDEG